MKFAELVRLEPDLQVLLGDAESYKERAKFLESFCANETWQQSLKWRLARLVGFERKNDDGPESLFSSEAWDTAFHRIYNVLPACRKCGCL